MMKPEFRRNLAGGIALVVLLTAAVTVSARPPNPPAMTRDPYVGAMVVDADSGQILFADNPDAKAYPASVLKLMNLLVILDQIQSGRFSLQDQVRITAEASKIGGSQVYLKENETFTIDELLYALMVQSGNDAAMALAIHVAGSKDGFVELMNRRARELGMKSTEFHSVHGLPPASGQKPDVTTARDLIRLARELLKYPDSLRYTSTREHGFRNNSFIMRTHNHLLGSVEGCDGLKTGYFSAAGYSITATACRGKNRVIAVVLGSPGRRQRDAKASELIAKGFLHMPPKPAVVPPPTNPPPETVVAEEPIVKSSAGRTAAKIVLVLAILALVAFGGFYFMRWRSSPPVQ